MWACVQRREGDRPAVRWVASEAWSEPAQTLRAMRRRDGVQEMRRVLLLDRDQYRLNVLDAPEGVPRQEWADGVRWQLKDSVDFPVDNAAIDVLAVPDGTGYRSQTQLIAVAAADSVVRPQVELAHRVGLPWSAVDISETALRNLCALVEPENRAVALLHCQSGESGHTTLVVTWQGELLASRRLDLTQEQLSSDDEQVRQHAWDQAVLELQRSLDGIERSYGQVTLAQMLVTPMPGVETLCEHLRPLLYVPVAVFDAQAVLDLGAVPALSADARTLNHHLCAIGAALRSP